MVYLLVAEKGQLSLILMSSVKISDEVLSSYGFTAWFPEFKMQETTPILRCFRFDLFHKVLDSRS